MDSNMEQKILQAIDRRRDAILEFLKRLISFPSVT
ncbi:unnamed protein product, partial [marine sediment metagenome]